MQEGLGLVLSELAPFLKLYVHYISKFDSAMRTLTEVSRKEKKFEAALRKFEVGESISPSMALSVAICVSYMGLVHDNAVRP